ncbi:hypothetical protein [Aestuariivirga sp.]|uniref:hypothetical protein n=1 Tax=Aestuariivirga sp. TaxID=2650926 RepID=UPI0035B0E71A
MSSILAILMGSLEGWLDRAVARKSGGDTARGEFIRLLIIDRGTASGDTGSRQRRSGPRS